MADFQNFAQFTGEHNTSLPTLSDGQASPLQLDSSGRLIVQADVSVELDAGDGDNVAISDGTDTLEVNGDGSINVVATATDLDIRDLSHTQDSIQIGDGTNLVAVTANNDLQITLDGEDVTSATHDNFNVNANIQVGDTDAAVANPVPAQLSDGTDTLEINADGSINVQVGAAGTEADASTDSGGAGDGLEQLTAGPDVLVSIAHTSGTYLIHGWNWASDRQCAFKLEVRDGATLVETIRATLNSGAVPGDQMNFGKPIEIAGAATRVIRVTATRLAGANGNASAGINGETI